MKRLTGDLYIGDVSGVNPIKESKIDPTSFDNVVCLADCETPLTTEFYPITAADKGRFFDAVDAVRKHIESGEMTYVYCAAGVSRNVVVSATALAVECGMELQEALDEVRTKLGSDFEPPNHLLKHAKTYLEQRG